MVVRRNQRRRLVKSKIVWLLLLLVGVLLTACSVKVSETESIQAADVDRILIQSVSVHQGDKIELSGTTTLPDGNCVYTRLFREEVAVDWWPVGKCFPITGPDWQFSIPLGEEGAPTDLDREAAYVISVWWPGAPETTNAEFPFDLATPPAP
jgi:hypothetical protein